MATKASLAADALKAVADAVPAVASSDPLADLAAELADFQRGVSRPGRLSVVGTMLQDGTAPEARQRYQAQVIAPRRRRLRAILERAQKRGLIDRDADLEVAVTMCTGSWYARALASDDPPPDWPTRAAALGGGPWEAPSRPIPRRPGRQITVNNGSGTPAPPFTRHKNHGEAACTSLRPSAWSVEQRTGEVADTGAGKQLPDQPNRVTRLDREPRRPGRLQAGPTSSANGFRQSAAGRRQLAVGCHRVHDRNAERPRRPAVTWAGTRRSRRQARPWPCGAWRRA